MKTSIFTALLATLLSASSFAKTIENVLVGPGVFPTQPDTFITCVAQASIAGSKLQFVGLGTINLLASDVSRIEIQFLAKDEAGKTGFLKIIANSTDAQKGWQKIYASGNNTFYFSSSVSSVALVTQEGAETAVVFDFSSCQN